MKQIEGQAKQAQVVTAKELSWEALEYPEYKKHPLWFMGFAVVTALLVLYGILSGSWTTAVLFGLFGVLGIVYSSQKPKTVVVRLTGLGIQVGGVSYSYRVIKKFWIIYFPPDVKSLYLETNAYLEHIVKIELADQDPRAVKEFLKEYVEEDLEETESLPDVIARKIRF